MEKSAIDMILDEDCNENIVLYDEDNNAIEFEQVCVIPQVLGEDNVIIYVMLHPISGVDDIEEDDALVFRIDEIDGEPMLVIEDDQNTIDWVFDEYYALLDNAN